MPDATEIKPNMPSSVVDPSNYTLTHITHDADRVKYTRDRNLEAWQGQLATQDYVIREGVLGKCKITSSEQDKLLVFELHRSSDCKPLLLIEILIRRAWRYRWCEDIVVQEPVMLGCIGAVYTYPENRGQGLAKIMVDKLLVAVEDYIGDGFIFLYLEIGEYYAKNGFKLCAVDVTHIPMTKDVFSLEETEIPLHYHNFGEYMQIYANQLEATCRTKVEQDHKTRVAMVPSGHVVDWFHVRSKYIAHKMFYDSNFDFATASYDEINDEFSNIEPDIFGVKLEADDGLAGFIIWTIDWLNKEENYATVLKCVSMPGHDEGDIKFKLLMAMRNQLAHKSKVGETRHIVYWESEFPEAVRLKVADSWKAQTGIENGSRLAILMNNKADNDDLFRGEVVWEGNDKIPWF